MTSIAEETGTSQTATAAEPKPAKKAHIGKRARNVAPKKAKAGNPA